MNFGTISLLFKQIFEMTLLKFSLEYLEIFRTLPQSFPSQQNLTSYMMHLNVALTIKKLQPSWLQFHMLLFFIIHDSSI